MLVGKYLRVSRLNLRPLIIQLLVLGEFLLSVGKDGKLIVWRIGSQDLPEVMRIM